MTSKQFETPRSDTPLTFASTGVAEDAANIGFWKSTTGALAAPTGGIINRELTTAVASELFSALTICHVDPLQLTTTPALTASSETVDSVAIVRFAVSIAAKELAPLLVRIILPVPAPWATVRMVC